MNDESKKALAAPPLPATRQELEALRRTKSIPTINEATDIIVDAIWENDDFQRYLLAINDEQSVEGTTETDDVKAAEIIKEYAEEHGIASVSGAKLHSIVLAMRVKLRRHNCSREQRYAKAMAAD